MSSVSSSSIAAATVASTNGVPAVIFGHVPADAVPAAKAGPLSITNFAPVPVWDATAVAAPTEVIGPVRSGPVGPIWLEYSGIG